MMSKNVIRCFVICFCLCIALSSLVFAGQNVDLIGQINNGLCYAVDVSQGNVAYVGEGGNISMIDISNPSNPKRLKTLALSSSAIEGICYSSNDRIYVLDGTKLYITYVNTSGDIALHSSLDLPGYSWNAVASGNILYVADIYNGIQIIDVTDPVNPAFITTYTITGGSQDLVISENLAYVASMDGLQILDISNPSLIIPVGFYPTAKDVYSLYISGSKAYIADGNLEIIDISNPAAPIFLGTYETPEFAEQVVVSGSMAYIGDSWGNLELVGVTNPAQPNFRGYYSLLGRPWDLIVSHDLVYLADGEYGLLVLKYAPVIDHLVINGPNEVNEYTTNSNYTCTVYYKDDTYEDITDIASWSDDSTYASIFRNGATAQLFASNIPTTQQCKLSARYQGKSATYDVIIKNIPNDITFVGQTDGKCEAVFTQGNYTYISEGMSLVILDMTTPTSPKRMGNVDLPYKVQGIFASGTKVYIANDVFGLQIIDVGNPSAPVITGSYDTPGIARSVYVSGNNAYIADDSNGLQIIDISNPSQPVLRGFYDTPGIAYDVSVSNNIAYVADGESLQIIDVINPARPTFRTSCIVNAYHLLISENTLYLTYPDISGTGESVLKIIDITDPSAVTITSTYYSSNHAYSVWVSGSYAYLADYTSMVVINVANPANPIYRSSYDSLSAACSISASGNYIYVADANKGLCIINISSPSNPILSTAYASPNFSAGVYAVGNTAYIADGSEGLKIVDTSNPLKPSFLGAYNTPGFAYDVYVAGNYAYVADGESGLQIIDVSNPADPILKSSYNTTGIAKGVFASGPYVYIADGESGLQIIDISFPTAPILRSTYDTTGNASKVCLSGNIAYVADGESGVQVIDISNPSHPILDDTCDTPGTAYDIQIYGNFAYVADGSNGIELIFIYNPLDVYIYNNCDTSGSANNLYILGNLLYIADYTGVQMFSLSNPYFPAFLGAYDTSDYCYHNGFANDVFALGSIIYVANNESGLLLLRYSAVKTVATFDFNTDEDGWTSGSYETVFTPPIMECTTGSLTLQAKDANTFGFWRSPLDAVNYVPNCLYRATFTVRGSAAQEDAPAFRYHLDTQSSTLFSVGVVESWMGGVESPSETARDYTVYFDPMDLSSYQSADFMDDLFCGFDMMSFNPADDLNGKYFIDSVKVERFEKLYINATTVKIYDTSTDFNNWTFTSYPDSFKPTKQTKGNGYLELISDNDNTNTYSCWESSRTANEVDIQPNKMYRARFTITTNSTQQNCPQIRLRIGTESNKMTAAYIINSNLDAVNSPNTAGKTYDVYLFPPQSDVGADPIVNGLIFSMDMLNFGGYDDPNGNLQLQKVEVQTIDMLTMP